jgi:ethanolamine utilization protein EutA
MLTHALEMAAALREPTQVLSALTTKEVSSQFSPMPAQVLSFSGGVADCIETGHPALAFGDMGPTLGKAIRSSRLCKGEYVLGTQTIRATVIGAGCHSAQLSGSTVFHKNITFPLKNLPVVTISTVEQNVPNLPDLIRQRFSRLDTTPVLALPGFFAASYSQVKALAETITHSIRQGPVYLALEQDMAKALGQALSLHLAPDRPVLCLDRLRLEESSYLDVGTPIGPALPVVIKTLILER